MSYRAGIGEARSRGPAACGDATVQPIDGASLPILSALPGSDPQWGPSSALRRAPFMGMRTKRMTAGRRHNVPKFVMMIAEATA
jgi:hypothetical protein